MKHKDAAALMGRKVLVTKVLRRGHGNRDGNWCRWWTPASSRPRAGWVVGYRHLQSTATRGRYSGHLDWHGFRHVEVAPRTPCLLVCFWPTEKAVRVPLDGYELGTHVDLLEPVSSFVHHDECRPPGPTKREELREAMKGWPRDSKGRWLPRDWLGRSYYEMPKLLPERVGQ